MTRRFTLYAYDNVAGDTGVVRALAQCPQGAGDDVDEAPVEPPLLKL